MARTHYILAGGNDRATKTYWERLAKATIRDKPLHVLSCMFAREPDIWEELHEEFKEFFKLAFGDDMKSELADPSRFTEQLKKANVVYLHGGETRLLKKYLAGLGDLTKLFEGKTVIGSSAGAQILSQQYWSCGDRKLGSGLKITPFNVLVHYGSSFGSDDPRGPIDWDGAKSELQNAIGDADVTPIPEGEFVEFTVG